MQQQELVFFPDFMPAPPAGVIKHFLNPENPQSPYYGFIGNTKAVNKLQRIDFAAHQNYNHLCRELAVAVFGNAGLGKTELVRRHAKANGLPLVELSPKAITNTHKIFTEIQRVCGENDIPLMEVEKRNFYRVPPINVFIDEVHALGQNVVDGLLKATEYKDGIMVTEEGLTVDCFNVHWIIATTERGKLFDAFDTRFMKVHLKMYNAKEIAQIIQVNYPSWPLEVCSLVAKYSSRVPREALAFAREMQLEFDMRPAEWVDIAKTIAEDNEIDEYGMTLQRLNILKALGQKPIAAKRLPIIAGCKEEELDKFVMPWLLEITEDQPALVQVGSKGFCITEAGLQELDKRSIKHKGKEALAA